MTKEEQEGILNGEPKQSDSNVLAEIRDNLKLIQHALMDMNTLKAIELRDRGVVSGDNRLTPNEHEFVDSISKEESAT